MIIYTIGDSVVAGTELVDDQYDGFTGYYQSLPSYDEMRKNFEWKSKLSLVDSEHRTRERALAFPSLITSITGVKSINKGVPGSSFDSITRRAIIDLLELKVNHKDILVLVGTTETQRFEIPFPEVIPKNTLRWKGCFLTIPEKNRDVEAFRRFKARFENEYHRLYRFYQNVVLLKDFCKVNSIKLYFVDTTVTPINDSPEDDLQLLKKYANLEYIVSMRELAEQIEDNRYCPQGHFSKYVHELTAKEIVRKLRSK
jgi:hypothetical protein